MIRTARVYAEPTAIADAGAAPLLAYGRQPNRLLNGHDRAPEWRKYPPSRLQFEATNHLGIRAPVPEVPHAVATRAVMSTL